MPIIGDIICPCGKINEFGFLVCPKCKSSLRPYTACPPAPVRGETLKIYAARVGRPFLLENDFVPVGVVDPKYKCSQCHCPARPVLQDGLFYWECEQCGHHENRDSTYYPMPCPRCSGDVYIDRERNIYVCTECRIVLDSFLVHKCGGNLSEVFEQMSNPDEESE